uniref:Uncharacterized protein n=1 Tax=viral metagenome TaxID=1070528 RepID=A0A6H1ZCU8_9ZZZZ
MAMGEIGMFLPAESAYGTPGAYSQALRAEATKRASYLSEMDQFYSQLEESQRQFDEMLSFKEESWEDEMGLQRQQIDLQRKLGLGQLLLGMYQAKTQRTAARRSGEGITLGGRDEKLDFLREIWGDRMQAEEGGDYSPRYGKKYDPYEKSLSFDYSHYSDYM